ncbi:ABC transporter substrate-binding protein [Peptoniphilus gorbachii]|uniref:ABC transport system substrate-binding protein n=1 Tax=Peptoniphilus gorbachii TaxID=411567 RepID=A0ABS2MJF8_9FIRM|nr:ABC transporter substrate-binding protein [Peptoniphilus gorbachii]MBM7550138.1 putative ABC transport system substrate-binding protein [Peptoniphilus gorbachii]MDU1582441.1 ABC transporter substrate-binding protein [Peptoniphilus harei]MDU1663249.1 ABC transporter substrate-binding protein [Peptoniphilus harei]
MKNLKKMVKVISIGALALSLVGCAGDKKAEKEDGKIKIGAIQYIEHVSLDNALKGFEDRLKEEGIEAEVEVENLQGDQALTTTAPKKFEGDDYKLVYAISTPAAQGAKTALPNKNIVYSAVTDPVEAGLIEGPDKITNITGVNDAVSAKNQIESFLKIYPDIKTIGTIFSTNEANSKVQVEALENACKELGLKLETVGINNINDIGQALSTLTGKIDAYYALTDNTVASAGPIVAESLLKEKIPSLSAEEGQVSKGLLMSEGVDYYEHGRQAADLAIKILKGEDIKNIHAEDNKASKKKVNGKTAEALGLDLNNENLKDAEILK